MFWALAWALKISAYVAASYALNKYFRKDAGDGAAEEEKLEAPTVEEGRPVPVLWGTAKLSAPNVTWYGDYSREGDGDGGYLYFLHMMWCWCFGPVDAVLSLEWDDLEAPLCVTPSPYVPLPYPLLRESAPSDFFVNAPNLFGGSDQEGGVTGPYTLAWGAADQTVDSDLASRLRISAGECPAYRGLCYSFTPDDPHWRFYQGKSPYMKPHGMVARRCPNPLGLTGGAHDIDGNANPACMLYELLTDDTWGLRYDPALVNAASFVSAANTLTAEGFGLSMVQLSQTDGRSIANDILRHVDGLLYSDRATGLISMGLIRDDYDPEEIVQLDDDAIIELESFSRPSVTALPNKILLSYVDRDQHFVEKVASAIDLAGVQSRGKIISQDLRFPGIDHAELAQRVAERELKAASYPFAGLSLKVNRAAWSLRPGSVFRLSYAPLGISRMVCRVVKIAYGTIADGAIRIEAIEDAFGVDWTAYSPPAPSGWVWPLEGP